MSRKRHSVDQIIGKLRQADVELGQSKIVRFVATTVLLGHNVLDVKRHVDGELWETAVLESLVGRQQALVRLVRQFIDPSLHRGIRGLFYDPLCNIKESSNPHADRGSDRELCWQFHSYARHTTTPAVSGR